MKINRYTVVSKRPKKRGNNRFDKWNIAPQEVVTITNTSNTPMYIYVETKPIFQIIKEFFIK